MRVLTYATFADAYGEAVYTIDTIYHGNRTAVIYTDGKDFDFACVTDSKKCVTRLQGEGMEIVGIIGLH